MIVSFGNKAAREIWETNQSKTVPKEYWIRAKALLTIMHSTSVIEDLKIRGEPPNIRLHKLQGDRKQFWSINEIVNGKRGISADFAIVLEDVLGTSTEMWVRMQAEYDLWEARQAA